MQQTLILVPRAYFLTRSNTELYYITGESKIIIAQGIKQGSGELNARFIRFLPVCNFILDCNRTLVPIICQKSELIQVDLN